jgi:gas vesicle protein
MFPFRKTPPSKIEVAKKTVSNAAHAIIEAVPTEKIEDKFDELKKSAAVVALHAAQVAHHAGEVAAHKLEELQHAAVEWGESAAGVAHRATDSAHHAGEAATAKAQAAREVLHERAATLKDSAISLKSSLHDRASHESTVSKAEAQAAKHAAAQFAKNAADEAREEAEQKLADEVEEKQQEAKKLRKKLENKAREEKLEAEAKIAKKTAEIDVPRLKTGNIEVEYAESGSKWSWILIGLAVGATLAILFAPTSGRRSRAAIKDRIGKVGDGAVDAATATSDKIVDIAQRVEGLAHKVEAKLSADSETDDDATVTDRVRSVLGHHEVAKSLDRLNINAVNGIVTLRGPLLDVASQEALVAAIKGVPGVKDVVTELLTDEPPANPANYAS